MLPEVIKEKVLARESVDPLKEEEIIAAQNALGLIFHPDYLWIVKNFGFLTPRGNSIAGLGAMDQQENVVFLNHSMLSKELYRLPKNSFAISYENQFGKVLVFDNSTGEVFGYDYELKKGDILFPSVASLLDALYA